MSAACPDYSLVPNRRTGIFGFLLGRYDLIKHGTILLSTVFACGTILLSMVFAGGTFIWVCFFLAPASGMYLLSTFFCRWYVYLGRVFLKPCRRYAFIRHDFGWWYVY